MLEGEQCYSLLREGTTLWVGMVGSLVRIDTRGIERYSLPLASATAARHASRQRHAHGLWIGTTAGLMKFGDGRIVAGRHFGAELDRDGIESLYRDSDSQLVDRHGVHAVPRCGPTRNSNVSARTISRAIRGCSAIYEDRERNLWLGSQTESLFRLWNGWARRFSQRDGLSDPFVWSVARDPRRKNRSRHEFECRCARRVRIARIDRRKITAESGRVRIVFRRERSAMWIGTRSGIAIYADQKLERPAALRSLDAYQINAIVQNGRRFLDRQHRRSVSLQQWRRR